MIRFPLLDELRVVGYELFPGNPDDSGIVWTFEPGTTVIAGINGLGKTTLLMMILRSLTGPNDLTADGGAPPLNVVLPQKPVKLKPQHVQAFRSRVSEDSKSATVTLSASFGNRTLTVTRRLWDLYLQELVVDGAEVGLPRRIADRESRFQATLQDLVGLGSFVDVLLVLHHVVLFYENRPGALWDTNAQRHLLRALSLDNDAALKVTALERKLQSADSRARNLQARITSCQRRLRETISLEEGAEQVMEELAAEERIFDEESAEAASFEEKLQTLDEKQRAVTLKHESAKVRREEAQCKLETLKQTHLLDRFSNLEEVPRLALSHLFASGHCLLCNASANEKQEEMEHQIAQGLCPVCGTAPDERTKMNARQELVKARLDGYEAQTRRAAKSEHLWLRRRAKCNEERKSLVAQSTKLQHSMRARSTRLKDLRGRLPGDDTSTQYRTELRSLERDHREAETTKSSWQRKLRSLFAESRDAMVATSNELTQAFRDLAATLLVERVELAQTSAEPRYLEAPGRSRDRVRVPAYEVELDSAVHLDTTPRGNPTDVSESQRELIDLAFRLALVEVFGDSSTFIMETPEASLDEVAMSRVGKALAAFSAQNRNRLVVTSNLTNRGVITALLEEADLNASAEEKMGRRVLNLLQLAAPNQALLEDRPRYEDLLHRTVAGG